MRILELFKNRFILLFLFLGVFVCTHLFFTGYYLPTTDTKDLWFYSGLFMVLFSVLFIEPYYTSPKNVITNTVPLLLVFLSIKNSFGDSNLWKISFWAFFLLFLLSILVVGLTDENLSPTNYRNKIANFIKKTILLLGKGKIIYSVAFFIFLYLNIVSIPTGEFHRIFSGYFVTLLIIWGAILLINTGKINNTFSIKRKNNDSDEIGEIFGIQSKKVFLVKLHNDKKGINKFDIVQFRYSMQSFDDYYITGIIFDTYILNQEKWAKILQLGLIEKDKDRVLGKNFVYKVSAKKERNSLENDLNIENFVGVIIDGSTIGKIKFEYSKKRDDLEEGALLELEVGNKKDKTLRKIYYQVIGCVTEKEKLEERNETGFIEGEAIQLGEWQQTKLSFQKFGWVPTINTPIFVANTSNIEVAKFSYPEYKLGIIPNTTLPSVINLNDAVSHHMALLGVTGSGKSFLAREIINQLKQDTKVICVDFTGEWERELTKHGIENTLLGGGNIGAFLDNNDSKIGIVGLPAMSNTSEVLQQTEKLFETIFSFAKEKYNDNTPIKISLVLEEAHTITPETSFLGDLGDYGANKALVNKMSQVALQGRKYGVGMMIIAQRTANVSKTVLTQCNTVICFQAFDETSFNFLGNYVGKDLVQALPNLKQYHAIVTGKAIRSNMPMIVNLYKETDKTHE